MAVEGWLVAGEGDNLVFGAPLGGEVAGDFNAGALHREFCHRCPLERGCDAIHESGDGGLAEEWTGVREQADAIVCPEGKHGGVVHVAGGVGQLPVEAEDGIGWGCVPGSAAFGSRGVENKTGEDRDRRCRPGKTLRVETHVAFLAGKYNGTEIMRGLQRFLQMSIWVQADGWGYAVALKTAVWISVTSADDETSQFKNSLRTLFKLFAG